MKAKKYENGGKTNNKPLMNKTKKSNTTTSGIPGVGRPTKGNPKEAPMNLTPLQAKQVNNSGASMGKEIKKSTAVIPVKKKRLFKGRK